MKPAIFLCTWIAVLLLACTSDQERLQGYWRLYSQTGDSTYITLDIQDTQVVMNERSLYAERITFPLRIKEGKIAIPEDYYYGDDFGITNNQLAIKDILAGRKYDKSQVNLAEDIFSQLHVKIDLPVVSYADTLDERKYDIAYISVGLPKRDTARKQHNYVIQVNDVFISKDSILAFLDYASDCFHCPKTLACLNIDKHMQMQFVDSLKRQISKHHSTFFIGYGAITDVRKPTLRALISVVPLSTDSTSGAMWLHFDKQVVFDTVTIESNQQFHIQTNNGKMVSYPNLNQLLKAYYRKDRPWLVTYPPDLTYGEYVAFLAERKKFLHEMRDRTARQLFNKKLAELSKEQEQVVYGQYPNRFVEYWQLENSENLYQNQ